MTFAMHFPNISSTDLTYSPVTFNVITYLRYILQGVQSPAVQMINSQQKEPSSEFISGVVFSLRISVLHICCVQSLRNST